MQKMIKMLQKNHKAFDCLMNDEPTLPSNDEIILRKELILEEYNELIKAIRSLNRNNIAKEAADLVYVCIGTMVSFGIVKDQSSLKETFKSLRKKDLYLQILNFGAHENLFECLDYRPILETIDKTVFKEKNKSSKMLEILKHDVFNMMGIAFSAAIFFNFDNKFRDVFSAVHNSNMTKLGEDGKPIKNSNGKYLKGPNYVPADIASIIKN